MSRAIFVLLVAIAVLFSTATSQEEACPENQEWTTCGSACPPSCSNPPPDQLLCTRQCVIGCQCKKGYYLNDMNTCVSPLNC